MQAVFGSIANGTGEVEFKGNSHNKENANKRSEDAEEAGSDSGKLKNGADHDKTLKLPFRHLSIYVGGKQFKSLSESAYEYESRQVKRTYEEVAIVTGEEDESNVLQVRSHVLDYSLA